MLDPVCSFIRAVSVSVNAVELRVALWVTELQVRTFHQRRDLFELFIGIPRVILYDTTENF